MVSKKLRKKCLLPTGTTFVEVLISLAFGLIMIMGTLGFSYYARLDTHRSNVEATAARLSAAILESWKANGGHDTYDLEEILGSEFVVSTIDKGPIGLDDVVGLYEIDLDNVTYYATLSYKDATAETPKMLNVIVAWTLDRAEWQDSSLRRVVRQTAYMQD